MIWVAEGARAQGLEFETDLLDWHRNQRDPLAPLHNMSQPKNGLFSKITRMVRKDRAGPAAVDLVSEAARKRWQDATPAYRPKTLASVAPTLNDG